MSWTEKRFKPALPFAIAAPSTSGSVISQRSHSATHRRIAVSWDDFDINRKTPVNWRIRGNS
ncbi:MAG: hypothetical protein ACXWX8_10220 [Candidatus Binatia bacterium]